MRKYEIETELQEHLQRFRNVEVHRQKKGSEKLRKVDEGIYRTAQRSITIERIWPLRILAESSRSVSKDDVKI